jgi:hypothetical protein
MEIEILDDVESLTIQDQVVKFFQAMQYGVKECPLIEERVFKVYKPAYNLVGAGKSSLLWDDPSQITDIQNRGIAFIDNHYVEGKTAIFTPDTWLVLFKHNGKNRKLLRSLKEVLEDMGVTGVEIKKEQDVEINSMKVAGWAGSVCNDTVGETMLITFHADREFFETVLPAGEFDRTATPGDPLRGWDGIEDIIGPIDRNKFIQDLIAKVQEPDIGVIG